MEDEIDSKKAISFVLYSAALHLSFMKNDSISISSTFVGSRIILPNHHFEIKYYFQILTSGVTDVRNYMIFLLPRKTNK